MPAAFICSSSRVISEFVAAGPNHHQRIMMRLESGGLAKLRCNSEIDCAVWAHASFDVIKPETRRITGKKSVCVLKCKVTRGNFEMDSMHSRWGDSLISNATSLCKGINLKSQRHNAD